MNREGKIVLGCSAITFTDRNDLLILVQLSRRETLQDFRLSPSASSANSDTLPQSQEVSQINNTNVKFIKSLDQSVCLNPNKH